MSTQEKLEQLVCNCMFVEGVDPNENLNQLGESLDSLDLNFRIEKEFGFKIPTEYKTINELAGFIDSRNQNATDN